MGKVEHILWTVLGTTITTCVLLLAFTYGTMEVADTQVSNIKADVKQRFDRIEYLLLEEKKQPAPPTLLAPHPPERTRYIRKPLVQRQADGSYIAKGWASRLGRNHTYVLWALGPRTAPYQHAVAKELSKAGHAKEEYLFQRLRDYYAKLDKARAGRPSSVPSDRSYSEAEYYNEQVTPDSRVYGRVN